MRKFVWEGFVEADASWASLAFTGTEGGVVRGFGL